jgi:hypothetical protein
MRLRGRGIDIFASGFHNIAGPSPNPNDLDTNTTQATAIVGGNETRPRNVYVHWIIKS